MTGQGQLVGLVDRWDRAVVHLRRRYGWVDHLWRAGERMQEVFGSRLAAAVSYYGFFAAFSLAVGGYWVLARAVGGPAEFGRTGPPSRGGVAAAVNDYLTDMLPWVAQTAVQVGGGELAVVGFVGLLITGVSWVEALRSGQRAVWRLDQHPGNWAVRRLVDLGMLLALGLLLGASLSVTAVLGGVVDWLAPDNNLGESVLRWWGSVLEFGVNLMLAAAILTAVARLRMSPYRFVPPALIVASGVQVLNTVGRFLIARAQARPAYQVVAGSVGLLVYLYLFHQLILWAAAIAATSTRGNAVDHGRRPFKRVGEPHPLGSPEQP